GHGFGLHQCQDFKKLIHGTKTTGHNDKSITILNEQRLTGKKMLKGYRFGEILVVVLFKRKFNITSYRFASCFKSTAVSSFHNTGTTTSHGSKPHLGNTTTKLSGLFIINMIFRKTGRAKYGNTRPYEVQTSQASKKLPCYFTQKHKFVSATFGTFQVHGFFSRYNGFGNFSSFPFFRKLVCRFFCRFHKQQKQFYNTNVSSGKLPSSRKVLSFSEYKG